MKDRGTLSRRELLHQGAYAVVLASASVTLPACEKAELDCKDVSDLNKAAKMLRNELQYQNTSPHGKEKDCSNCQFFRPAKKSQCGGCTMVQGPINPEGYCNSWAPKES